MPDINKTSIDRIINRKIFFGHQSVGKNILGGVSSIVKDHKVKIIDLKDIQPESALGPAFYHLRIGSNNDPKSKVDSFSKVIKSNSFINIDIAFLKFCYVDITKNSNIEEIFNYYKLNFSKLRKEFPNTIFVHLTVPLTKNNDSWKTTVKKIIGKNDLWEYSDNIQRNRFNEMIFEEYQGKEPVFDLAAVQSTHPDGKREVFAFKGKTYFALVKEYTYDGGHLNELGSRRVAASLLKFLAEI
ncbi:MAG: hypothetical protein R2940_10895 [Syntrophotaleaceae bacterium]